MRTLRSRIGLLLALFTLLTSAPGVSWAHGSVYESEEGCVIAFDFYSAHFNVFQPRTQRHTPFCEDLPQAAESIFVLEYLHDTLREVPVEFRIIRNTSALGRFVRWPDLQAMGDLEADTVYFQRAEPQPDGMLTVLHHFTEPGNYVGIVSAPHPSRDERYYAVFPFSVGLPWWQTRWRWLMAPVGLAIGWRLLNWRAQAPRRSLV